jgi:hypothetical protein
MKMRSLSLENLGTGKCGCNLFTRKGTGTRKWEESTFFNLHPCKVSSPTLVGVLLAIFRRDGDCTQSITKVAVPKKRWTLSQREAHA